MRLLITDADERAALACVRAFGRAGHAVHVVGRRARSLAGASRWARASSAVPDALRAPADFADAVAGLVRAWEVDAVVPIAEAALLALLPERDTRLRGVCLPFPPLDTFRAICDKAALLAAAPEVGVAVPRQVVAPDAAAALAAAAALRFPVVVKPARSVTDGAGGRVRAGAEHAADAADLRAALARQPEGAYPLLLQERIVGPGIGVFALLWDGEVRALFSHERLRERPPAGGVSTYRRAVPLSDDLAARSIALLRRFAWQGVAMVEYKVDAATGTPYLMEVNGRFWGSLQLALDAGVDFPNLLLDAARGRPAAPPPSYRADVRLRWEWGDIDHLLLRLLKSDAWLALPPGAPGRLATLARVLLPWRPGDRLEVLRWSDPMPFVRESLDWLARR